jgi:hypothetical protein
MADEPQESNDTRMKGSFAGILPDLDRKGLLEGVETGERLKCDVCGKVTYTGRGRRDGEKCYRIQIDKTCCIGRLVDRGE